MAAVKNRSLATSNQTGKKIMKTNHKMMLTLLGGIALGGATIEGIHAQAKPPTYVVVALLKITDPDGFKTGVVDKAAAAMAGSGGQFVIRTDKITSLDGPPPQRFVVIAFDSAEKAQAWHNSAAQKEVDAARAKTTDSLSFMVDGMAN
jgi:uncharacterized protein (DUF1330 family)